MPLNPRQQEAVDYTDGPLLVLAGAGSGKTSVITQKIAHLIRSGRLEARHIAAVTFTNKAAREMKARVGKLLPAGSLSGLIVSTFHNLGLRILREELAAAGLRRGFSIFDQTDTRQLLKEILRQGNRDDDKLGDIVLYQISRWKNEMVLPDAAIASASSPGEMQAARAYAEYERMLRACNAVDFDDLIQLPVILFQNHRDVLEKWRNRIRYLLVDEYQDTNSAQYVLVKLLVEPLGKFTVVGDDDQSIYTWRGARPENLAQLRQDWPGLRIVKLEQNYRSTRRILRAANTLIDNNSHLFEKKLWSDHGMGDPIRVMVAADEEAETEWIAADIFYQRMQQGLRWKDFAILYRGNFQSRLMETRLQALQIPYKVSGGTSFFARTEIRDLMCYLRLLVNPDDDNAFLRIINVPRREIGPATLEKLAHWAVQRRQGMHHVCDDLALQEVMSARAAKRLHEFKAWLDKKRELCFRDNSAVAIREMIDDMNYEGWLHEQSSSPAVAVRRMENVSHLVASIERMLQKQEDDEHGKSDLETVIAKLVLQDMLEQNDEEENSDRVQLSTLHAAKGLEYPQVYIMGVEENLLPHRTSIDEDNVAEERRLMYVGITRARANLALSWARQRKQFGERVQTSPSRFLEELPQDDLSVLGENKPRDEKREESLLEENMARLREMLK